MKEIPYQSLNDFEKFQIAFLIENFKETVCNGKLVHQRIFDKFVDFLLDTEAICRVTGWRTIDEDGEMELEYHLMRTGYHHDPNTPTNLGELELLEEELDDDAEWWKKDDESDT